MYFTEHDVFLTELFRLNLCSNEGNIIFCDNDSLIFQYNWLRFDLWQWHLWLLWMIHYVKFHLQIRFLTDEFISPMVIHCHILQHEDLGMMMVVNIVPQGSLLRIIASTVRAKQAKIRTLFAFLQTRNFVLSS